MIDVALPNEATAGQVMACQATLVAALGWQLGELYDAAMRPKVGDDWLEQLRQARLQADNPAPIYKKKLKLHDFSFCLTEPAKNSNSPLRELLPKTPSFYDNLDEVIRLRNKSLHGGAEYTLAELARWASVFGSIGAELGLSMATDCALVTQRVNQLEAGAEFGWAGSNELLEQLRESQAEISRLAKEAARFQSLLDDQAARQSSAAELENQLASAEAARIAAEERAGQLEAALEQELRRERSKTDPAAAGITPGEVVPAPPPARTLRLLPFIQDFYDPEAGDLLSNQVGDVANMAAEKWARYLPNGGPVLLTESGQAFALVDYSWAYLGDLDDAAADSTDG